MQMEERPRSLVAGGTEQARFKLMSQLKIEQRVLDVAMKEKQNWWEGKQLSK